jgi:dTMP kinase
MFITFEGIEGCGKSTQAALLTKHLERIGVDYIFTREPGGTAIGSVIRRILLDSSNSHLSARAELFLYAADRAQHVSEVIMPALNKGRWVVCDRFMDATTVYQGVARRQDLGLVASVNEMACLGVMPDITFLIDCTVDLALERAFRRNKETADKGQDRFEREVRAFHEAVREGYLDLARRNASRFIVLDGSEGISAIEKKIIFLLGARIEGKIS